MAVLAAFSASVSGMRAQSTAINVIGGNVANVHSGGYKRTDLDFRALMGATVRQPTDYGGVQPLAAARISVGGQIISSESPLDVSVAGAGFFVVNTSREGTGETLYTRDGSLLLANGPPVTVVRNANNLNDSFADELSTMDDTRWQAADWANGGVFINSWSPDQIGFAGGAMNITLESDGAGGFVSGEYRTLEPTSYGLYQARMTASGEPGTVTGFFTYTGPDEGTQHDEIDMEILGDDPTKLQVGYWTDGVQHTAVIDLGFDASQGAHDYAFQWSPGRIQWYVDGALVHAEDGANGPLPQTPGHLMVNLWGSTGAAPWSSDFVDPGHPVTASFDRLAFTDARGGLNAEQPTEFEVDTGWLVDKNGNYILGWPVADDGTIDTSQAPQAMRLDQYLFTNVSEPTENASLKINLDGSETQGGNNLFSFDVFDSDGSRRNVHLRFTKEGEANAWNMAVATDDAGDLINSAPTTVRFNQDASLDSGSPYLVDIVWADGSTSSFNLSLDGSTQFVGDYSRFSYDRDGSANADMTGFSFDQHGYIVANFDDNTNRRIYRIPLANFSNPDGLESRNGMVFAVSADSGDAVLDWPGRSGQGYLAPNTREISNVNLETEFTRMIMTQRAYNASSKVFQTVDEVLQTTRDLKS